MPEGNAMVRHPEMNLEAPPEYWLALGAVSHAYWLQKPVIPGTRVKDEAAADELGADPVSSRGVDGVLLQGIEAVGAGDGRAIVWALGELQRRKEERERNEVKSRLAEAVKALAEALGARREQGVLAGLLASLTGQAEGEAGRDLS